MSESAAPVEEIRGMAERKLGPLLAFGFEAATMGYRTGWSRGSASNDWPVRPRTSLNCWS